MEPLVAGIYQCPQCKKIVKQKNEETEVEEKRKIEEGEFQVGDYFHKNASLNKKFEICEKGITIQKTENRLFAVLICHSAYLKDEKYVRLSWWRAYQHAGMFKIYDKEVLNNLIIALEKIDESFDDLWSWRGKFGKQEPKTNEDLEKEKNLELIKYRIIENKTCPKCQKKMDKMKSHYECPHCGEIVILEGYNQPIFNIAPSELDMRFHANFPINFYMPISGITVKWLMGEWKALIVIYSKDNPNKKWLRFYWWIRDLSNILKYGQKEMGEGTQMGWKAQKGVSSPNLYDKNLLKPLIDALKKTSKELNWEFKN
jgi:ssDNA-binding Zn-finger/Zn-ribbon topoisomerase 1